MKGLLKKVKIEILNLIYPIKCYGCNTKNTFLCKNCLKGLIDKREICFFCGRESGLRICRKCVVFNNIDEISWVGAYNNAVTRRVISDFKYKNVRGLALPISNMMADCLRSSDFINTEIIAVPIHSCKLRERGFNQSEILAKLLSDKLRLSVNFGIIERVRNTSPQAKKRSKKERKNDIRGAFKMTADIDSGKNYIIIDDVATTGSTLNEIARELKKSGATKVSALIFAIGK